MTLFRERFEWEDYPMPTTDDLYYEMCAVADAALEAGRLSEEQAARLLQDWHQLNQALCDGELLPGPWRGAGVQEELPPLPPDERIRGMDTLPGL